MLAYLAIARMRKVWTNSTVYSTVSGATPFFATAVVLVMLSGTGAGPPSTVLPKDAVSGQAKCQANAAKLIRVRVPELNGT